MDPEREGIVRRAVRSVARNSVSRSNYMDDLMQEGRIFAWQNPELTEGFLFSGVRWHVLRIWRSFIRPAAELLDTECFKFISSPEPYSESPRPLRLVRAIEAKAKAIKRSPKARVSLETEMVTIEMYYRHQEGDTLETLGADFGVIPSAVCKRIKNLKPYLEAA